MTGQKLKFPGNLTELKQFITDLGLTGNWRQIANNGHQFKENSGAAISWWPSTKTVQVDGNEPERSTVRKQIADALTADPPAKSANGTNDTGRIDVAQPGHGDSSNGSQQHQDDGWNQFMIKTAGGNTVYGYFKIKSD